LKFYRKIAHSCCLSLRTSSARAELQNNEPRLWNSFNRWEKYFFALPYKWPCTKYYRDRNLTIKVT